MNRCEPFFIIDPKDYYKVIPYTVYILYWIINIFFLSAVSPRKKSSTITLPRIIREVRLHYGVLFWATYYPKFVNSKNCQKCLAKGHNTEDYSYTKCCNVCKNAPHDEIYCRYAAAVPRGTSDHSNQES